MADEGVIAAMQPLWFYYDPFFSAQEESNLGTERFEQEYHIRDMDVKAISDITVEYTISDGRIVYQK